VWIKSDITEICVDDFAIKKRHSYGTIVIDIKSHRVIDLIPNREISDVTEWLKGYPNLKVVSRDGSVSYAAAIWKTNKDILQVSDRFHMIKGLSEACKRKITAILKANFRIPKASSHYDGGIEENTGYWEKIATPTMLSAVMRKV